MGVSVSWYEYDGAALFMGVVMCVIGHEKVKMGVDVGLSVTGCGG